MKTILATALLLLAAPALAQGPAATPQPFKIVSGEERVTANDKGVSQSYYKVVPGRPLKIIASGPMLVLMPARPIVGSGAIFQPIDLAVTVDPLNGTSPKVFRETLTDEPGLVTLSDNSMAAGAKVLKIPIEVATAHVMVSVGAGSGAVIGLARTPLPYTPVTVTPQATPTPAVIAAATPIAQPTPLLMPGGNPRAPGGGIVVPGGPLIRRKAERLSLGTRVDAVVPAGSVDPLYGDGATNVYVGAELRFTFPQMDRKLSLSAETGSYQLKDVAPIAVTGPFASTIDTDVTITTRVTPVLGSLLYKIKLGEKRALFASGGGGVVLTSRTEEVSFRDPTTTADTRPAAVGRAGFEQKIGPGRVVVEGAYLHVVPGTGQNKDTYLGGGLFGLQYRFIF